ncbi:MAG: 3',5'-cyclic AMP phosphodiesterase CpdA [Planctomycetota bacterium]|jgi:3',5'-cyclic AMP phosphodiesterase CpdA
MAYRTLAVLLTLATSAFSPAIAQQSEGPRLLTNREAGKQLLKLPKEEDSFGFIVFGDRTGGPAEGIKVLDQAVVDTNLLDPDLVMTVGDLINGYNQTKEWMTQADEFKASMSKLRMPWFPVAGNHDIYWRGKNKPAGEHESNYETVFGPLWYAVQHKKCWFIVLYSDEGNPDTGEKNFSKPECQRISKEQLDWLSATLQKASDAPHVFVFLHHPRWLKQYGDDWQQVHKMLAANGNVRAVFAGHIHHMRYGGAPDGIEYYTVASVGAHLGLDAPQAGFLHQYHVVTVRPEGIKVAAVPVGTVIDPKTIPDALVDDVLKIHRGLRVATSEVVAASDRPAVTADGTVDAVITLSIHNPGSRAIELELIPSAGEPWSFGPDHQHVVVAPNSDGYTTFSLRSRPSPEPFTLPTLEVRCDYLAVDRRVAIPSRKVTIDLPPPPQLGNVARARNGILVLDGKSSLKITDEQIELPNGAITLECWLRGDNFAGRRGLITKTEMSDYGLFCSDGTIDFSVLLGDRYVSATSTGAVLRPGTWHHVAGVFDGKQVRIYVDGLVVAMQSGKGRRRTNKLPLYIGADTNKNGKPTSHFIGSIDDVRLSKVARYVGKSFDPPAKHVPDNDTVLLIPCDRDFGPWTIDRSKQHSHPRRIGNAYCTVADRK